jgi:uncharacterized protein YkwD
LIAALLPLPLPAHALDVNSFRAQHKLPPLTYSSAYAGAAQAHANDLARRDRLDHAGFRERVSAIGSRAAENVAYIQCRRGTAAQTGGLFGGLFGGGSGGCSSADAAYRMWARSPGHRANMLMPGITQYGLGNAVSASGKHYWVLELGN